MRIQTIRRILGGALAGLMLAGSALAGNGALLGVATGYPLVNFVAATLVAGGDLQRRGAERLRHAGVCDLHTIGVPGVH